MNSEEKKELNFRLKVRFAGLDINGKNVDSYYKKRFDSYKIHHSELSDKEKTWIQITGHTLDNKNKIIINVDLSETTFIQDELLNIPEWKKYITGRLRQKVNNWEQHLIKRQEYLKEKKQGDPKHYTFSLEYFGFYLGFRNIDPAKDPESVKTIYDNFKETGIINWSWNNKTTPGKLKTQFDYYKKDYNRTSDDKKKALEWRRKPYWLILEVHNNEPEIVKKANDELYKIQERIDEKK